MLVFHPRETKPEEQFTLSEVEVGTHAQLATFLNSGKERDSEHVNLTADRFSPAGMAPHKTTPKTFPHPVLLVPVLLSATFAPDGVRKGTRQYRTYSPIEMAEWDHAALVASFKDMGWKGCPL